MNDILAKYKDEFSLLAVKFFKETSMDITIIEFTEINDITWDDEKEEFTKGVTIKTEF